MHKAYEKVVTSLIEAMEKGIIPWRRPWTTPINAVSGKPYRGINFLMLATSDFQDPRFLTYLQAQQLGGNVKRGAEGFPVVKWHFPTESELLKNPESRPWARSFTVFSVEQCEGLTKLPPIITAEYDSISDAQSIIDGWADKPKIEHGGYVAGYNPIHDAIRIPEIVKFKSAEAYYDTLFHELTHSTGHPSRLCRDLAPILMKQTYGFEELVAEIGGAMLCSEAHIDNADLIDNNAAYLLSWLQAVKNDPAMLPRAASLAAKAVDLIMGRLDTQQEPHDNVLAGELLVAA